MGFYSLLHRAVRVWTSELTTLPPPHLSHPLNEEKIKNYHERFSGGDTGDIPRESPLQVAKHIGRFLQTFLLMNKYPDRAEKKKGQGDNGGPHTSKMIRTSLHFRGR